MRTMGVVCILRILRGIDKMVKNNNNNQEESLEKLRDTLLPKLMSGQVRVEYD